MTRSHEAGEHLRGIELLAIPWLNCVTRNPYETGCFVNRFSSIWYNVPMSTTPKSPVLNSDLKAFITTSIKEVLDDPDFGLELTATTMRRLRAAKNKKQKLISHAELKKRLY